MYISFHGAVCSLPNTWSDNKVRELITVKVLNMTVVAFKALPLGSYAPMPMELVLWNGLQSCRRINPDVINVIKIPSFQYCLMFGKRKKSPGARSGDQGGCSSTAVCLLAKNSLTDRACRVSRCIVVMQDP
jgi:hypothetical protein